MLPYLIKIRRKVLSLSLFAGILMKYCLTLEKIRSDLELIAKNTSFLEKCEYQFADGVSLLISIDEGKNDYSLRVNGPLGEQEANLEDFDRLLEALILFVGRQLIEIAKILNVSPCRDFNHGKSEELLAIIKALRLFEEEPILPYSFDYKTQDRSHQILEIIESDNEYKITVTTHDLHNKQDKRVTSVRTFTQIPDKVIQLMAVETVNWLTPEKEKTKRKSGVFSQLSVWFLPTLAAGIIALGGMVVFLFYFQNNHDWKKLEKMAEQKFDDGKSEEAVKLYHKAIIQAEMQEVSDEVILGIYKRLVDKARSNAKYETYLKEAVKLIVISKILDSPRTAELTMFEVARDEFHHKNYKEALAQLQSVIPLIKKSRGKKFFGLIRAYELLGRCFMKLHQPKQAEEAFLNSLSVYEATKVSGLEGSIGFSNYYLGVIAKERNDNDKARTYLTEAQKIEKRLINSKESTSILDKRFLRLSPTERLKELKHLESHK